LLRPQPAQKKLLNLATRSPLAAAAAALAAPAAASAAVEPTADLPASAPPDPNLMSLSSEITSFQLSKKLPQTFSNQISYTYFFENRNFSIPWTMLNPTVKGSQ
jgi:hypothetical protein